MGFVRELNGVGLVIDMGIVGLTAKVQTLNPSHGILINARFNIEASTSHLKSTVFQVRLPVKAIFHPTLSLSIHAADK